MSYMAYFIIAGACGLGYLAYIKRKDIFFKSLLLYNKYIELPEEKEKNINIKHFILKNNKIENYNYNEIIEDQKIITKISTNKRFISILDNNLRKTDNYYKLFNEKDNDYILACTIKLDVNDENILDEYDVTNLISSFLLNNSSFNINSDNTFILIKYIFHHYNIKKNIDINDKLDCKWVILDKDVNMFKSNYLTMTIDNNKLIIETK